MRIGDKKYLLAEKRGMNFAPGDRSVKNSDVGNYRLFIRFINKEGAEVCGDIMRYPKTGNISTTMCYYDGEEICHGFPYHWKNPVNYDLCNSAYPYTKEGILRYVNKRSNEGYTDIMFVQSFSFTQESGSRFDIEAKIKEWIKDNRLESLDSGEGITVKLYTGIYRYMMTHTRTFSSETGYYERVTVFLQEVPE